MKKLIRIGFPEHVINAISAAEKARTKWEEVSKVDVETKNEILRKIKFVEEETGERITDTRLDFLMSEHDFEYYLKLAYEMNCEKGFDTGSYELNFWPIQKAVYDAEDALIDIICAELPDHYTPEVIAKLKQSPKLREKFLSITGL